MIILKNLKSFLKNRENISIIISILTLFSTIYIANIGLKSNKNITELQANLNKKNEIESRLYQQKYDLYKDFSPSLSKILYYPKELYIENNKSDYFNNLGEIKNFITNQGSKIRLLGGDEVVKYLNCISKSIYSFHMELKYGGKEINENIWNKFQKEIVGGIYLLENEMRKDLGLNNLPVLQKEFEIGLGGGNIIDLSEHKKNCEIGNSILTSDYIN